jgi:Putative Ig domain
MPSRLWRAAVILAPSLLLASLGAAASATAATTTSNPSLITSDFACTNGVCEVGPGNVGIAFGAELNGTGGPPTSLPDCPYLLSVISGSLPPGLQLGGVCGNIISGTPTQAGTYPFTVQVTSLGSNEPGVTEPSGTQPLTITIGTGKSDRLLALSASYNAHTKLLSVTGYDANSGALYTLSVTSTGKVVFPAKSAAGDNGELPLAAGGFAWPCPGETTCSLTVSDSLGSSATVTLPPAKY